MGIGLRCALVGVLFWSVVFSATSQTIVTKTKVVYSSPGGSNLVLDMAYPSDVKSPVPALVFLPGNGWGAWKGPSSDRRQCTMALAAAAARGYVAVSIDLRSLYLFDSNGKIQYGFPTQIVDARNAIRWLRTHASELNVDPHRIGVAGWSSGGHTALLVGYLPVDKTFPEETIDSGVSADVQAVVSIAGPTDMARHFHETEAPATRPILTDLLGGTPEDAPDRYRDASPVTYVTPQAPPTLLIQGGQDPTTRPAQAQLLADALKAVGARVDLVLLAGHSHDNEWKDPHILDFFDSVLKP